MKILNPKQMLRRLPIDFAKVKAGNRSDILLNKIRKMALIDSAISLQLKWSKNCILVAGTAPNQNPYLEITYKTLCSCCKNINSR